MVALLWPRIGKQDEDALDRGRGQGFDKPPPIIGKQPDIAEPPACDLAQQPGDAVLKNLTADQAEIAMRFGLRRQVLTAAKADLKPYRPRRCVKERGRIEFSPLRQPHFQPRQQLGDQHTLARPQRPAAFAPVKPGRRG